MAPIKRRSSAVGEEVIEVLEQASSSLQSRDQRKRARLSNEDSSTNEDDVNVFADDDGTKQFDLTQLRSRGNHRAEYERHRDEDEDSTIAEDEIQDQATQQAIRRRAAAHMDNQAAEAGVIEEVVCTNFMCHAKLHVTFGPLINFIIGHNGSGKSAVLTALTLCLGGKATSTNRGQSLKSFVKEGQDSATLSVKIKNQGDTAYKRDSYGDSIIVERHFTIQGASGFKIKNSDGRIISTKRSELDDITDFYAMQLDNPVNVLTQDMARQFLNNSTPYDKYKFFIKGVQLEQLDNDYILLAESLDGTDAKLITVEDDVKVLCDVSNRAQEKLRLSERQGSLREKLNRCGCQLAWAQVEQEEKTLDKREEEVNQAEAKIQERKQQAHARSEEYQEADRSKVVAESSKGNLEEELRPLEEQMETAKTKVEAYDKDLSDAMGSQRMIKQNFESAKKQVETSKERIKTERERLEAADGGSHANKLAEIDRAKDVIAQVKQRQEDHGKQRERLASDLALAKKRAEEGARERIQKQEDIDRAEGRLFNLQKETSDPMEDIFPKLKNLKRAIQNESRFVEQPVGPMASHVRLSKPEWSPILEAFFGGVLNAFIVTRKSDQVLLSDLIRKSGCNFQVFIGNKNRINTENHEPSPEFDTVMRVLDIDNDLVRNQLIINQGIEQVVLIKNRGEAFSTIFEQGPLRNVRGVLCFASKGSGLYLRVSENGNRKSDPVGNKQNLRPRMKTDVDVQIRLAKESLLEFKQDYENFLLNHRNLQNEELRCIQAVNQHNKTTKDMRVELQRAEDDEDKLEDELEGLTPQAGMLDELENKLRKEEEVRDVQQGQFDDSVKACDSLKAQGTQLAETLQVAHNRVEEQQTKIREAEKDFKTLSEKRSTALRTMNEAMSAVMFAEEEKRKAIKNRDEQAQNVKSFEEQATEISERVNVPPGETVDSLEKKYGRMVEDLKRHNKQLGGNQEEITLQAHQARQTFLRAEQHQRYLEELASLLTKSLAERRARWKTFRKEISGRARIQFKYLLSERGFRGSLTLDHLNKALDLAVEPDKTREESTGRQTKTLSGGEKSFSTICLLLALWDAMGSPIRCLDEFDVFMDSVNRNESMKMIIKAARRSVGRQYILITPQSMNHADLGPDVRVHRLSDPERGQTSIDFES